MPNKTVNLKPVTGPLDTRSTPDEVPFGGYRWLENWRVVQKNKLCRLPGFVKHLDSAPYNNQDLHDQLHGLDPDEVITLLYNATTSAGVSQLVAGTQKRLFAYNSSSKNWVILTNQYDLGGEVQEGCPTTRFQAAHVNDTVVFTNNVDEPVYWTIGQPPMGPTDQFLAPIPDLDRIGISKASVVVAWKNFIILGNVVSDGLRVDHRIVWSDYGRPLSFSPATGSVAGTHDLGSGETILAMKPLGNQLMIYTTGGVWLAQVSGGEAVLSFQQPYKAGESRDKCLAYPNTLVSSGDAHYYMGGDGIYSVNLFSADPERLPWVHRASGYVYDTLNTDNCQAHIGGFNAAAKEVWFSWAQEGQSCPSKTIALNVQYPFASFIDHGFTAFCNYDNDVIKTFRDFLLERCICNWEELDDNNMHLIAEGGNCDGSDPVDPECEDTPASIYTTDPLVIGTVTTEDYTNASPDADSLCALLDGLTPEQLCEAESAEALCDNLTPFIMVSVVDNCIKQGAPVYYREVCEDTDDCGTYVTEGYLSVMRSGALDFKIPTEPKLMSRVELEAHFPFQTVPSQFKLRTGFSPTAHDPNLTDDCQVRWVDSTNKNIQCLTTAGAPKPNKVFEWPVFLEGNYVYFELSVVNPNSSPVNTGGEVCISRAALDVIQRSGGYVN